jgi:hypothetical protein
MAIFSPHHIVVFGRFAICAGMYPIPINDQYVQGKLPLSQIKGRRSMRTL